MVTKIAFVPTANSSGVESVIIGIAQCEEDYRDGIENALRQSGLAEHEEELLVRLDGYLPGLVYAFNNDVPPPRERGGGLVLEKEYYEWRRTSGDLDARRQGVIRSYLATETELRGQFRLSRTQNSRIADHYNAMGEEFIALGMPGHAAMAFQSAADLYWPLQQKAKRERALLNWRRAQHRARPKGATRFAETLYDAICGYGYRPFRMLGWMVATLAVFSVAVWLTGSPGYVRSLHGCLIDFLNPLAFGSLDANFGPTAQVFLIIESYIGSISMAIFFAFLVRG
jgi:hypothetical protein